MVKYMGRHGPTKARRGLGPDWATAGPLFLHFGLARHGPKIV
jgi:hypothetical protein